MKHDPTRRVAASLLTAVAMLSCIPAASANGLSRLRCEYLENPLGIDESKPRLSWMISDSKSEIPNLKSSLARGQLQTAYQILVASSPGLLANDQGDLWDSGKVVSDRSIQVEYAGKPLESRQFCHWKVRVWDKDGKPTAWSAPAGWSMGMLKPDDWQAKWVKAGGDTSPWLRKEFTLTAAPERAMAYVNVKGYYELYVNGRKVSDDVLAPAVSVYDKRSLYTTYDIGKFLRPGPNCVGVWLGLGLLFPKEIAPLARVQLDMAVGGKRVVIGTDNSWMFTSSTHTEVPWAWCGTGREKIDARLEIAGWNEVGCTSAPTMHGRSFGWRPVEEYTGPTGIATAQSCPPSRITKVIPAVACVSLDDQTVEFDFGTNLSGWFHLRLPQLEAGKTVTMYYADKRFQSIDGDDTPAGKVKPAQDPKKIATARGPAYYQTNNQQTEFISAGKAGEEFCNKFNYVGFRYVIVQGLPAKPAPGDAEALFIESVLEPAGSFSCSNDLLNRIHQVNLWTLRCLNLGGYMVDCPHRERMGYGDGQNGIDSHVMNLDAAAFYGKWAVDWLDAQDPVTGKSAQYSPPNHGDPSCWFPWGGMVDVMPWKSYIYYGDRRLLERAYGPMVRYPTLYLESFYPGGGIQRQGGDSGCDWVAPNIGMTAPPGTELFVNCYRVYLYDLLAKSADVLGRTDEAKRHRTKARELKALIHSTYYDKNEKLYDSDRQLSQAAPLLMDVVPDDLRGTILKRLEEIILVKNKGHLDTGMLGTYFLLQYLMVSGRNDLAHTIINQRDFPGWGYMLSQGATTFWEQWNGSWSQIHSCYVSPGSWFYQGLAGIRPDESGPGFKKIIIKPAVVGDVTWVKCHYDSIHGRIVSNWKLQGAGLTMEVSVPANTTATVYVPAKDQAGVTESGVPAAKAEGVSFMRMENHSAVFAVGSGNYRFQSAVPAKESADRPPANGAGNS
jgi:alpha-L-rhamnosidase